MRQSGQWLDGKKSGARTAAAAPFICGEVVICIQLLIPIPRVPPLTLEEGADPDPPSSYFCPSQAQP
jgi:hypothetical protein